MSKDNMSKKSKISNVIKKTILPASDDTYIL